MVGGVSIILIALCALAGRASAQALPSSPGTSLIGLNPGDRLLLQGSQAALAKSEVVPSTDPRFSKVIRVSTKPGATTEWNIQVATNAVAPVATGDVCLAHFWMRCAESMTGEGSVGFVFELNGGDYAKAAELRLSAGSEWTEMFVPFAAPRDFDLGKAHVCFRVGYDRQTIELAKVEVVDYGRTVKLADLPRTRLTYSGRDENAAWRKAALARIEKTRKGDLQIQVVDAAGQPVSNAKVEVDLRQPKFGIGFAIDAHRLMADGPDGEKYRHFIETFATRAVFGNDMKWPAVYSGVPEFTDNALAWLTDRGIEVRGHNLIWGSWQWLPKELQAYKTNLPELRRVTNEHVTSTVSHFKGKVIDWDVVNEPYTEHDLTDLVGKAEMPHWFQLAAAADPGARLFINDYGIFDSGMGANGHADAYFDTIKFLKDNGAPLGGIGLQSHFASHVPPPEAILKTLDRFATFGLPIESTEISFNFEDRQLQADYVRDYMIATFSHPATTGLIHWGFWAPDHWRPQAAYYNDDWSPRPAAAVLEKMLRDWRTHETLTADSAGTIRLRGFLGKYAIKVSDGSKSAAATVDLTSPDAGATLKLEVK